VLELITASLVCAQQTPEFATFILGLIKRLNNLEQGPKHLPHLVNFAATAVSRRRREGTYNFQKYTDPSLLRRLQDEAQIKVKW
jgi:hypothetical protein